MKKSLFLAGILALSSISFASSKTYEISLANTSKAGSVQLKAGSYRVKVDGDKAVFTDVDSSKQYTITVKVQTVDKKFGDTKVDATRDGNVDTIKDIQLGGSTTEISF